MARQYIAEGSAQIIDDEGCAVQHVDRVCGQVGRAVQQQLCQALTPRAGPHLLGRQRREEVAGLLLIDDGYQRRRGDPTIGQQAHVGALPTRAEDGPLQQRQHIGIRARKASAAHLS